MAYDFFPKTEDEIINKLGSTFPTENLSDIVSVFSVLKKEFKALETPINIDLKKPSMVNVSRALQGDITISKLKSQAKTKKINMKFGNGSSGNRGVANRGNLFEPQFATALIEWYEGKPVADAKLLAAIEDMDKTYNIRKSKKFKVNLEGAENTRRPLVFGSKIFLDNPKGQGKNVGKSVTDITVDLDSGPLYLSLKLGTTTTFFNVGVKSILTKAEIQKEEITNANGLKLLNLFGIDPVTFCRVFNGTLGGGYSDQNVQYNPLMMKELLESGIGHGYHIIHKLSGKVISKEMSERAMQKAAKVGTLTTYYGGKTGTGKRIDMEFASSTYKFKINIRDTQGGDGYPTRMMCDFTYV